MRTNSSRTPVGGAIVFALMAYAVSTAPAAESDVPLTPGSPPTPSSVPALLDERVPEWMETFHVPGVSIVGIEDRRIAWERLAQLHRRHIEAQRRSVKREVRHPMGLSDRSTALLAGQLAASGTSVRGQLVRKEVCLRVRQALDELPERDREAVVLRHLEQLSLGETAAVLGISTEAARSRYRRAIERLHDVLSDDSGGRR